jgi:hypothetical protein
MIIPDNNSSLKAYALSYAANGFPVFPCKNKRPITAHGFKDASTDPEQIMAWWEQTPDARIGVPTAGYMVVDIDPKNGGDKTLAEYEAAHGSLPLTPKARTGSGGYHYWFRKPTNADIKCRPIAKGIDTRTDDGYVIVPPSVHDSGNAYAWVHDLQTPMAEAPAGPVELTTGAGPRRRRSRTIPRSPSPGAGRKPTILPRSRARPKARVTPRFAACWAST